MKKIMIFLLALVMIFAVSCNGDVANAESQGNNGGTETPSNPSNPGDTTEPTNPQGTETLTITVVNEATDRVVRYAAMLEMNSTILAGGTSADGGSTIVVKNLKPGTYLVDTWSEDYQERRYASGKATAVVEAGKENKVTVVLERSYEFSNETYDDLDAILKEYSKNILFSIRHDGFAPDHFDTQRGRMDYLMDFACSRFPDSFSITYLLKPEYKTRFEEDVEKILADRLGYVLPAEHDTREVTFDVRVEYPDKDKLFTVYLTAYIEGIPYEYVLVEDRTYWDVTECDVVIAEAEGYMDQQFALIDKELEAMDINDVPDEESSIYLFMESVIKHPCFKEYSSSFFYESVWNYLDNKLAESYGKFTARTGIGKGVTFKAGESTKRTGFCITVIHGNGLESKYDFYQEWNSTIWTVTKPDFHIAMDYVKIHDMFAADLDVISLRISKFYPTKPRMEHERVERILKVLDVSIDNEMHVVSDEWNDLYKAPLQGDLVGLMEALLSRIPIVPAEYSADVTFSADVSLSEDSKLILVTIGAKIGSLEEEFFSYKYDRVYDKFEKYQGFTSGWDAAHNPFLYSYPKPDYSYSTFMNRGENKYRYCYMDDNEVASFKEECDNCRYNGLTQAQSRKVHYLVPCNIRFDGLDTYITVPLLDKPYDTVVVYKAVIKQDANMYCSVVERKQVGYV